MDPSQQESRQAAAEAFMESLNQLEQSLGEGKNQPVPKPKSVSDRSAQTAPPSCSNGIDVKALEEAAADIEQFMQLRTDSE